MPSTERCRLLEPDGTLLTTGRCRIVSGPRTNWAVVNDLAQPGRVVRRCLLDHLRDVAIELDSSFVLRGQVKQVHFDADQGRVCTVRLEQR